MSATRKSRLREAMSALEEAGRPVRALRLHLNGAIDLLTETPEGALDDTSGDLWELAGQTAIPRA